MAMESTTVCVCGHKGITAILPQRLSMNFVRVTASPHRIQGPFVIERTTKCYKYFYTQRMKSYLFST